MDQTNILILLLALESVGEPCLSGGEKQVHPTRKVVDTILDNEFQNLCMGIQKLMEAQHIIYNPQPPLLRCEDQAKWSSSAFSPFVSKYVSSMPVQSYVNTLCEKMNHLIQAPRASEQPVAVVSPPAVAPVPTRVPPVPPSSAMPAPAQPTLPSPPAHPHTKISSPLPKSQALSSKPQATLKSPRSGKHRLGTVREVHLFSAERSADPKSADVVEKPMCSPSAGSASQPPVASVQEISSEPTHAGTSSIVGGSVIGQIKPDVLCTLMEIMQKNAVKFYIQRGDEESELCTEIKV